MPLEPIAALEELRTLAGGAAGALERARLTGRVRRWLAETGRRLDGLAVWTG